MLFKLFLSVLACILISTLRGIMRLLFAVWQPQSLSTCLAGIRHPHPDKNDNQDEAATQSSSRLEPKAEWRDLFRIDIST
jgi:hypothetical protein